MKRKLLIPGFMLLATVLLFAFVPAIHNKPAALPVNTAKDEGIKFAEPNWAKALQEAKKQKKMIFIDAYTTWCGPCRMLKKNTFTDKAAGDFFNKHFINIALDMESGDGIAFAEKYQIRAYPTLLIMDADQKSVSVSEGYINASQLIEFGKYVINKLPKIQ
jgi:thiol:disulfide interchange protein